MRATFRTTIKSPTSNLIKEASMRQAIPRTIELCDISERTWDDRRRARSPIALRGVRVRSRVSGMCQKTTVEQMFVNMERRAIEAIYTFPLPDAAAVCGFEVITGDRVLTGTVEENDKAI